MVATQLPKREQDAILHEALESARAASADSYDKGAEKLLSKLAISLAAMGGPDEAMTVARSIRDQEIVVTTYAGIAPHLKQNQLNEILMEGRSLRDSSQRAKVLMAVAPYLEAQDQAGLLAEALEAAKIEVSEQ
jgi:hypothetical protein